MEDPPYRYDFMRELGSAVDGSINRAKARVDNALHATDVALRGRKLTPGELHMIAAMFGTIRGFTAARVYPRNFWWPYPNDRAITPEGNIFFPGQFYQEDYSSSFVSVRLRALFMHECTHLYQWYILGQWVFVRGPFDRNYKYVLTLGKAFKDYGLEQMGQIVEDYYSLQHGLPVPRLPYSLPDYSNLLPLRVK